MTTPARAKRAPLGQPTEPLQPLVTSDGEEPFDTACKGRHRLLLEYRERLLFGGVEWIFRCVACDRLVYRVEPDHKSPASLL